MNSKYLKYALGEIVLVVIGILIALSINNANESRKARNYELKMLLEIENALGQDIPVFENFDSILSVWNTSIIYLTNEINKPKGHVSSVDSIQFHLTKINEIGVFSIYNNGPYEALKSSGMDKISNDELRNEIARLYSRDLPSIDIWINEIMREHIFNKYSVMDELFDIKIEADGIVLKKEIIIEDFKFLSNPTFHELVGNMYSVVNSTKRRMKNCAEKMIALRLKIDQELQN
ncbi:MAG: hypothetical protein HWE21_11845 [Cytophagia bacterium]|nr:hypothetical protein [Cytophagia bacterium]